MSRGWVAIACVERNNWLWFHFLSLSLCFFFFLKFREVFCIFLCVLILQHSLLEPLFYFRAILYFFEFAAISGDLFAMACGGNGCPLNFHDFVGLG